MLTEKCNIHRTQCIVYKSNWPITKSDIQNAVDLYTHTHTHTHTSMLVAWSISVRRRLRGSLCPCGDTVVVRVKGLQLSSGRIVIINIATPISIVGPKNASKHRLMYNLVWPILLCGILEHTHMLDGHLTCTYMYGHRLPTENNGASCHHGRCTEYKEPGPARKHTENVLSENHNILRVYHTPMHLFYQWGEGNLGIQFTTTLRGQIAGVHSTGCCVEV